ncbi:MAG: transporter glutamine-binding protein GlnH precursor [Pseudomonadota bacterium]
MIKIRNWGLTPIYTLALSLSLAGCMRVWTWGEQPAATTHDNLGGPAQQAESLQAASRLLAPTGVLRVGVYSGSPTSLVKVKGERYGIAFELGHALGHELGVPVQIVEFPRVAEVIQAISNGKVDFTFTNASVARAKRVDFTPALVRLELGVLVAQDSPLKSTQDMDRAGLRLGVSQGSTSEAILGASLKQTQIMPQPSLAVARQALQSGELDAFATNKGILFELADQLPRHRILPDAWGHEQLAIAIPQGRALAMPWLRDWAQLRVTKGQVNAMAQRAGLRGLAATP